MLHNCRFTLKANNFSIHRWELSVGNNHSFSIPIDIFNLFSMNVKKTVLAISGSTRENSSNQRLIQAIADLYKDDIEMILFESIAKLPHFNPEQNEETLPLEVRAFQNQINMADGVLICTPEYAHGVPGSLKNAIDWTVSAGSFSHKPTVLITASTEGNLGHQSLLETLKVIEAKNVENLQLLIQFIRTKITNEGIIKDEMTLEQIKVLMKNFLEILRD